ncbi:MAG: autotransporter domain-containing protein [Azospirillum sp.]|nr:autotransporter domain-containing protein [Azospirillum sp.]
MVAAGTRNMIGGRVPMFAACLLATTVLAALPREAQAQGFSSPANATISTTEGQSVTTNIATLNNCPTPTTLSIHQSPAHGTAGVSGLTSITYAPNSGFSGSDSYQYNFFCTSPSISGVGTITINVQAQTTQTNDNRSGEAVANTTQDTLRASTGVLVTQLTTRISQIVSPGALTPRARVGGGQSPGTLPGASLAPTSRRTPTPLDDELASLPVLGDHRLVTRSAGSASRTGSLFDLATLGTGLLGQTGVLQGRSAGASVAGAETASLNLFDEGIGLSGGDGATKLGVWGSASYTRLRNSLSSTAIKGPLYSVLFGADYKIAEGAVVGGAFSVDITDIETTFNDGSLYSVGYAFSPYAGYAVPKEWLDLPGQLSFDVLASFGRVGTDTSRNRSTTRISGNYDADRYIFAANANYNQLVLENWDVTGRLGYSWSRQGNDHFTEDDGTRVDGSSVTLGQGRAGAKVGYLFEKVEPYIGAAYLYDFVFNRQTVAGGLAQPKNDRDEVEGTIGVAWTPTDTVYGGFEIGHGFFREDNSNTTITLHLRGEF